MKNKNKIKRECMDICEAVSVLETTRGGVPVIAYRICDNGEHVLFLQITEDGEIYVLQDDEHTLQKVPLEYTDFQAMWRVLSFPIGYTCNITDLDQELIEFLGTRRLGAIYYKIVSA